MSSRSLQRMVSPRREQYSHLLDEMVGCGDMVMLDPLSEETLMENLRKRYKGGHIYVSGWKRGERKKQFLGISSVHIICGFFMIFVIFT